MSEESETLVFRIVGSVARQTWTEAENPAAWKRAHSYSQELFEELSKWKSLAGEFKLALQALMESDGVGEFIEADNVLAKAREMGLK